MEASEKYTFRVRCDKEGTQFIINERKNPTELYLYSGRVHHFIVATRPHGSFILCEENQKGKICCRIGDIDSGEFYVTFTKGAIGNNLLTFFSSNESGLSSLLAA